MSCHRSNSVGRSRKLHPASTSTCSCITHICIGLHRARSISPHATRARINGHLKLLVLSMRSCIAVPVTRRLVRVSVGSCQFRLESPQVVVVVLVDYVDGCVLVVVGRSREGVAIWVDHCGIVGYPCAWQRAVVTIVDGAVDGDRRRKAKEDAVDFESVGSSVNRRDSSMRRTI